MDIEQLKLILDLVGTAGEGAFTVAIVYFSVGILKSLIGNAALVAVVVIICRCIPNTAARIRKTMRDWDHETYPTLSEHAAKVRLGECDS
jgi:hypothetical protein